MKVVKVFSSLPSTSQQQTGAKPLVQIVPSPQGNLQQQSGGRVADMSIPKVVSVQSLQQGQAIPVSQGQKVTVQNLVLSSGHKIHLQTPVTQNLTPTPNNVAPFQVRRVPIQLSQQQQQQMQAQNTSVMAPQTPVSHNQLSQQISSPIRSSPALPASYRPLESLQEVNRQTTQGSVVSPVSAVIPETKEAIKKSPTEIRNQVTVRDRFRYIVPSPQNSVSSMPVSTAVASSGIQLVQTSTVKPAMPVAAQPVGQATVNQVMQVLQ